MHLKSAVVATFLRQMVVMGMGLLSVSIISRVLGPVEFGKYALVIALSNLGQTILSFSVPAVIIHFFSRFDDKSRFVGGLLTAVLTLLALIACVILGLYQIDFLERWEIDGLGVLLIFLLVSAQIVNSILEAVFLGNRLYKIFNLMQMVVPFSSLLGFVFFLDSNDGWHVAILLILISTLAATPFYFFLSRKIVSGFALGLDLDSLKKISTYGLQMWSANLITMALYRAPIFAVEIFCSRSQLGVFALANNFSEKVWVPGRAVATILFPERSSHRADGIKSSSIYRLMLANMFASLMGIVFLSVFFYFFSTQIFGVGYEMLYQVTICLMPGIVAWSGVTILGAELAGLGLSKQNFFVSLIAFLATIIAAIVLSAHGMLGVAIGASIGYAVGFILSIFSYQRACDSQKTKKVDS